MTHTYGDLALNGFTKQADDPHLDRDGCCNCDCQQCATDDDECICPDCNATACRIHRGGTP